MHPVSTDWSRKIANHFTKLSNQVHDAFLDRVIRPQLFSSDSYVPVAINKATKGRHSGFAELLSEGRGGWDNVALFANQLAQGDDAPKDRVVFGHRVVFTFESDTVLLERQVDWTRSRRHPTKSILDQLFARLSAYRHFEGITANWSGSKSVHLHIVISTDGTEAHGIGAAHVREGLVAHWLRLCDEIAPLFGFEGNECFDPSLRFPESYRRRPNGLRDNGERQFVLFEQFRSRRAGDGVFWQPQLFTAAPTRTIQPDLPKAPASISTAVLAHARTRLATTFPGWPCFHDLRHDGTEWRAFFRNEEGDTNATSVMREGFSTIAINGTFIGDRSTIPSLPFPLGVMIALWTQEIESGPKGGQGILEQAFAASVTDGASAAEAMASFLMATRDKPLQIVRAPEGAGKSSTMFKLHRELTGGGIGLYAFTSYAEAQAKAEAFNAIHSPGSEFVGIVLPSFSQMYANACASVGANAMSVSAAAKAGHGSHLSAIEASQPKVMAAIRELYARLWSAVGDKVPAFFTVHDVACQWSRGGLSRAMASPRFWTFPKTERWQARDDLRLALMVHDEARADTFVELRPRPLVDRLEAIRQTDWSVWCSTGRDVAGQLASYERAGGKAAFGIEFDEVRSIMAQGDAGWERVTGQATPDYRCSAVSNGAIDIYAEAAREEWCVAALDWWTGAADRVVVLTTEVLPVAVAERSDARWATFSLEAPGAGRDTVEVYTPRGLTSGKLVQRVGEWLSAHGQDWSVVSNVVKGDRTMSHLAARGSNAMIGEDVLQTLCFMSPGEYGRIAALNAWCDRSDLAWVRHLDEVNQSIGRNKGFRGREGVRHVLAANRRLFVLLAGAGALGMCRYELVLMPGWV